MNELSLAELFTPEKVETDRRLAESPETRYIASGRPLTTNVANPWHIGVRKFSRYSRSGLIAGVSYVAKCNGGALGGPWGDVRRDALPVAATRCSRCFKEAR